MLKRLVDILLSSMALLILCPLFLIVMLLLLLTGEGKIFYRQNRVGQDENYFGLIKFATMYENSSNMEGGNITAKNDPRVLPVGKFLRRYKINELPQIINVIFGEMSIIGRRPTVREHYDFYDHDIKKIISKFKPGLSGISSIVFRDEEQYFVSNNVSDNLIFYRKEIAPYKGELEIWYCNHQSFIIDISLIIFTFVSILFPEVKLHNYFFQDLPRHSKFNP